jgi:hypothetical protein
MSWQIALARVRMPLLVAAALFLILGDGIGSPQLRLGVMVIVFLVALRAGAVRREPRLVVSPVSGRWVAMNSPADRVPSHGVHVYGQSYAVDLVHEPPHGERPRLGMWPLARRPTDFPAFGQPVHAPVQGSIVRVHDRERDHWSRNSWLGVVYMLVEGVLREVTGPSRILGNHVVIRTDDGTYAVLAHLRRRSVQVHKGEHVQAGDHIAACGNSGNSSEPHLHLQLMDHPNVLVAAGLPMSFVYQVDGNSHSGIPPGKTAFDAQPVA